MLLKLSGLRVMELVTLKLMSLQSLPQLLSHSKASS